MTQVLPISKIFLIAFKLYNFLILVDKLILYPLKIINNLFIIYDSILILAFFFENIVCK